MASQIPTDRVADTSVDDAGNVMRALALARSDIQEQTTLLDDIKRYRDHLAVELVALGWSERDVAEIAGLSHARVHQLRKAAR